MWRETRQRVTFVVVALVAAACTSGDADSTSTTELSTTSTAIETTTTEAQPTTTTTRETTTTTIEFTDTVGSPEALGLVVDEALANSALAFPNADLGLIGVPDLNTPDPTLAARALLRLEYEVSATAPAIDWLEVVAAPESPASSSLRTGLETLSSRKLRVELSGGDFTVDTIEIVDRDALAAESEDRLPEIIPEGSVFILAKTSSPPFRLVDEAGDEVSGNPGWNQRPRALILTVTDVGWQIYWEENL